MRWRPPPPCRPPAAYGFLADVTAAAEQLRCLGPARYDVVGAAKLLAWCAQGAPSRCCKRLAWRIVVRRVYVFPCPPRSRAYPARIRYIEGEVGRSLRKHATDVCRAACRVCAAASFMHSRRISDQQLALASAPSGAWPPTSSTSSSLQASPTAARAASAAAASPAAAAAAVGLPGMAAAASSASLSRSAAGSEPPSPAVRQLLGGSTAASPAAHFLLPAAGAAERHGGEEWREVQGEYCSIMLIVMPCRSDKTRSGMARHGHLADGQLKLVLVRKCSPLQVGVSTGVEPGPPADGGGNGAWQCGHTHLLGGAARLPPPC